MSGSAHGRTSLRTDAANVNRPNLPRPTASAGTGDAGRTILEAVVALALIAIAVTTWGRMSVTAARTDANVAHREVALELATNTLEELRVRTWTATAIDPATPGFVRRFEGLPTVRDASGVAARVTHTRAGRDFEVTTHLTDPGDDSWRNAIVIVEWAEGERTAELRLDSALRRPDTGDSP